MNDRAQVIETLAKYLHATDGTNRHEATSLCAQEAVLAVYALKNGSYALVDEMMGVGLVDYILQHAPSASIAGTVSRRLSTDHVVTITGDTATLRANFFVSAWGLEAGSAQIGQDSALAVKLGGIIQSGFFLMNLTKRDGVWKITHLAVYNDIPGQGFLQTA